ncbi:RcnB family protein [Paraburkholderia strydomiana]|uniref:RcnB family protein n=1 Tax=Paraburkholderia strydomiana TaxID=1245417 RepID=UPI001BEBB857|nr:RcnB family protein [Paraburkholderia strydomiana]MBT2793614.1 RcnB family protein [Paraburkholderia strydomiana]
MRNNIVPLLLAVILVTPSVTAFAQQWHQDRGAATQDHGRPGDQGARADQERFHGGGQADNRNAHGRPDDQRYGGHDQGWHGGQQADNRDGGPIPHRDWHRGDRLPGEYRDRNYVGDDWRGHGLRQPPRGYHWVGVDGDYVLAAVATGVIASILLSPQR